MNVMLQIFYPEHLVQTPTQCSKFTNPHTHSFIVRMKETEENKPRCQKVKSKLKILIGAKSNL